MNTLQEKIQKNEELLKTLYEKRNRLDQSISNLERKIQNQKATASIQPKRRKVNENNHDSENLATDSSGGEDQNQETEELQTELRKGSDSNTGNSTEN